MSRSLTTTLLNALDDEVIRPFFAVELQFDSAPLRIWTGVGTATIDGEEYTGLGNLLAVSPVEETAEISARGATLTLSGVPSDVLSAALTEPYQGRVCKIFLGVLSGTSYSGLTEIFSGYMDVMLISEGAETSTVELKVESKLIDLERPRTRRYTSAFQKSRFPSDKGFDFVESIQNTDTFWGRSDG
jgi:hypothetical protein